MVGESSETRYKKNSNSEVKRVKSVQKGRVKFTNSKTDIFNNENSKRSEFQTRGVKLCSHSHGEMVQQGMSKGTAPISNFRVSNE